MLFEPTVLKKPRCRSCGASKDYVDVKGTRCTCTLCGNTWTTGFSQEGGSWCPVYKRFIDNILVNEKAPPCIQENNGCGNCPRVEYKVVRKYNDA